MKRLLFVLLALGLAYGAVTAFAAAELPYLDKLPPLIDREVFFGDPEIAGGQISPDGKYISFLKTYKGNLNIWVKGIDEPFDAARPMSADTTRPVIPLLLVEGREIPPLHPGQGRKRELPRLRDRSRREARGRAGRSQGAGPHADRRRDGHLLRVSRKDAGHSLHRPQRSR